MSEKPEELKIKDDNSVGSLGEVSKLEPYAAAGMYLATGVGIVIIVTTLAIMADWMAKSPWLGVPSGLAQMDGEKAKAFLDNLKTLSDMANEHSMKMFDAVVARSLLPVFTAILGYIFGTRASSRQNA